MTSCWHHIVRSWLHIIDCAHCGLHDGLATEDLRLQTGSVPDHCPFARQVRLMLPLSWNPRMQRYCATAPKPAPVMCSRASLGGSKLLQPTAAAGKSYIIVVHRSVHKSQTVFITHHKPAEGNSMQVQQYEINKRKEVPWKSNSVPELTVFWPLKAHRTNQATTSLKSGILHW